MKKLTALLIAVTLGCLSVQAQTPNIPIVNDRICYTEVVAVDSVLTKSDLYTRVRQWFAKNYKSANSVIQMDDKDAGVIVGKALMQVYHKGLGLIFESGYINYTVSVYVKDGRYKYEITDFYHTGQRITKGSIPDYGACEDMINTTRKEMGFSYQKTFDFYLKQMQDKILLLVADLNNIMKQPPQSIGDDW